MRGTDVACAERARRVEDAIRSGRMACLDVTPATREDAQEYAEGKISAQELRARVRSRYGVASAGRPGDGPVGGGVPALSGRSRALRAVGLGVLAADLLGLGVGGFVLLHRATADVSGVRVVDSQCIDGHMIDGLDLDGRLGGPLLAQDTGVTCDEHHDGR